MKIIVVEPAWQSNNSVIGPLLSSTRCTPVYTLADTALLTHGKPMFIPDYGGVCEALCCVVARISRMGKSIPQRFAARYFDALTVGVRFELSGLRCDLSRQGQSWDAAVSFDGAASIGGFVEMAALSDDGYGVSLNVDGENVNDVNVTRLPYVIAQAVSYASMYYTVRQGDVLFVPVPGKAFLAVENTHYVGRICGNKVLEFNVK